MNYQIIRNVIGKMLILIACLLCLPLLITLINKEGWLNFFAFLIPIVLLVLIGVLFTIKKAKDNTLLAKEGFVIVALSWLVMSLFGCLPFIISGQIPNFFDALFETASGFTTTGASILDGDKVELLTKSMQFWRSFTHWIGGMGVLVFILAIIPESDNGSSVHILRAESPGPQVGKLVSKMKVSSRILYIIYIVLTLIEFIFLWAGPDAKMDFFSSIIYSLGTAGTGGFGIVSESLGYYGIYSQYVVAIFMFIFGINFNIFYFVLIGKFKEIAHNEELKWYLGIIVVSVLTIFLNVKFTLGLGVEQSFRFALFESTSIMSTTGYGIVDINTLPVLSQAVIGILMVCGACAGSTAGGVKVSRIVILFKSLISKIKKMIAPRKVSTITVDKKSIQDEVVDGVEGFFIAYVVVVVFCALLVSFDGVGDLLGNLSCSLSCVSNVGPYLTSHLGGLDGVSFAAYSSFSKVVFTLEMIAGRLELFPILILLNPRTWKKRSF